MHRRIPYVVKHATGDDIPCPIAPGFEEVRSPDCFVVAVPTAKHAQVLDQVSVFGKPIFVEKPITADVGEAARFRDRRDIYVMDKWRYHPGVTEMKRLVDEGTFGSLTGLQTTRHSLFNPHHDVDAIWILAPHDLSIVLELKGGLPPAVAATGDVHGVEGRLLGLLGTDVSIDVSSRSHVFRREVRAIFEEAVVTLEGGYAEALDVRLTQDGVEPLDRKIPLSDEMPLAAELAAFLAYVQGGPPPKSSASDGANVVERIAELRALAGITP